MKQQRSKAVLTGTAQLSLLTGVLLLGASCGSTPRTAPRAHVPGVDRPHEPGTAPAAQNPGGGQPGSPSSGGGSGGASGGGSLGGYLDDFIASTLGEISDPGAKIAVFPAVSPWGSDFSVSELGMRLARDVARGLEAGGQSAVLSGEGLKSELERWNRGTTLICGPESCSALADWMECDFAVRGIAEEVKSGGAKQLEITLECVALPGGSVVSDFNRLYTSGPLATELYGDLKRTSRWDVCDLAAYSGSLDLELQLASAKFASRILARNTDVFGASGGKTLRMRALPALLPGTAADAAAMRDFSIEFQRRLGEAMRKHQDSTDPRGDALREPASVGGKSYPSLNDAAQAFRSMRRDFESSDAGRLAKLIGEKLARGFKANGAVPIEILMDDDDLDGALALIAQEAARISDGAIDDSTIGFALTEGTELMLRSELTKNLDDEYEIRIKLTRLFTDQKTQHVEDVLPLFEYFATQVDARLSR